MTAPLELWLRNAQMQLVGPIESYTHFQATIRAADIGDWTLDCPAGSLAGEQMRMDSNMACGPVVRRGPSDVLMSGYIRRIHRQDGDDGSTYTMGGYDDTHLLWERLAHPDPFAPIGGRVLPDGSRGYLAEDVRVRHADQAAAEFVDINCGTTAGLPLGTGAGHPEREILGLRTIAYGQFGAVITGKATWGKNLGVLVQEICSAAGLRFWIEDALNGLRYFHIEPSRDLREVLLFSMDVGNVRAQVVEQAAPITNYVWGGDDSTAGVYRAILEAANAPSIGLWGRSEGYANQRSAGSSIVLMQAIQHMLAEGQEELALTISPTETLLAEYGVRWRLGDRGRLLIDGQVLDATITEATIDMTPDHATITPVLTTSGLSTAVRSILGGIGTRLTALESGPGGWVPGDIKAIVGDPSAQGIEWAVANGDDGTVDLRGRYPAGIGVSLGGAARTLGEQFGSDALTAHHHAETVHHHAETVHAHTIPPMEYPTESDTGNVSGEHGAADSEHTHPLTATDVNSAHDTADNAAANTADNAAASQIPPSTGVIYMQRVLIP